MIFLRPFQGEAVQSRPYSHPPSLLAITWSFAFSTVPFSVGTFSHCDQPPRSLTPSVVNSILVSLQSEVDRPKLIVTSSNVLTPSRAPLEGSGRWNLLADVKRSRSSLRTRATAFLLCSLRPQSVMCIPQPAATPNVYLSRTRMYQLRSNRSRRRRSPTSYVASLHFPR